MSPRRLGQILGSWKEADQGSKWIWGGWEGIDFIDGLGKLSQQLAGKRLGARADSPPLHPAPSPPAHLPCQLTVSQVYVTVPSFALLLGLSLV